MSRLSCLLLLTLTVVGGCQPPASTLPAELPQADRSPHGIVSAAHPLAAQAGAEMLELGGTAVDAAVAAAFTLSVVEPSMSGLGGRVQILIRTPEGEHHGIDGSTQAPFDYDPDTAPEASYGYGVVGIPGVPAGLLKAHASFGKLPRGTVMAPAIRYAEEGFALLPGEARRHQMVAEELAEFEGSRAYFLKPDGTPHEAGDVFRQPDLAQTLRVLQAEGAEAFYQGSLAEAMAADLQANGSTMTLEALSRYEALDSRVVRGSYRGHDLVGLWLPSFGAITIELLHLLESVEPSGFSEADWSLALAEAIRVSYLDRASQGTWEDAERLTSKSYAQEMAAFMRTEALLAASPGALPDGNTTHLTVADNRGMVVALTQSLGPNMGSKVAAPGLGFLYASTLGGYLGRMEAGERAISHISPFMVERDGEPFLALGAAGGARIITAIAAVVSRVVDGGMSLPEALQAPRVLPAPPDEDGDPVLLLETETGLGFGSAAEDALEALGFEIEVVSRPGAFGRIHAVRWHSDAREWEGAADPDWEGAVARPQGVIR